MDEGEVIEVHTVGGAERMLIHVGLDAAMLNARSDYIHGRIEVADFEREVERILRKRLTLRAI